jgi:ABC-type polysaccharide/polyol phosphate export permease
MLSQLTALKNQWLSQLPENPRLERIWLLAKSEFKKRYYGSFLGVVWAFVNPLVQLFIYYYIFTVVFKSRTENFTLFLFLGILLWTLFVEGSTKGLTLIKSKRYLLENIQINRLDIYYASLLSTFMGFLFNFTVYLLISLFFDTSPSWEILLVPLLLFNLLLFVLGVQILLSVIHVFLNDILHVWKLSTMVLFWLSGIIFQIDPGATWKTLILSYLTPMFGIIANARAALIYGEGFDWGLFVYDYAYAGLLLMIALLVQRKYFGRALELL